LYYLRDTIHVRGYSMSDLQNKRFLWGVALAWAPWVPAFLGLASTFRMSSEQKAVGLGAIAGGFAEAAATFGLAVALIFEVGALVLLARSFDRGHRLRSSFSVISICLSALMIFLLGLYGWFVFLRPPYRF
jgi:hypothetical protein